MANLTTAILVSLRPEHVGVFQADYDFNGPSVFTSLDVLRGGSNSYSLDDDCSLWILTKFDTFHRKVERERLERAIRFLHTLFPNIGCVRLIFCATFTAHMAQWPLVGCGFLCSDAHAFHDDWDFFRHQNGVENTFAVGNLALPTSLAPFLRKVVQEDIIGPAFVGLSHHRPGWTKRLTVKGLIVWKAWREIGNLCHRIPI